MKNWRIQVNTNIPVTYYSSRTSLFSYRTLIKAIIRSKSENPARACNRSIHLFLNNDVLELALRSIGTNKFKTQ